MLDKLLKKQTSIHNKPSSKNHQENKKEHQIKQFRSSDLSNYKPRVLVHIILLTKSALLSMQAKLADTFYKKSAMLDKLLKKQTSIHNKPSSKNHQEIKKEHQIKQFRSSDLSNYKPRAGFSQIRDSRGFNMKSIKDFL